MNKRGKQLIKERSIKCVSREECGHTHHVELMVVPHCADVEGVPNFLGVGIVRVSYVRVGQRGEEDLLGWELSLIHLLQTIHVFVRVYTLAYQQPRIFFLHRGELLSEVDEPLQAALFEVVRQGCQT